MDSISGKTCREHACNQQNPQPSSEFFKNKYSADGLDYRCKSCRKVRRTEWGKQNPDKERALKKRERIKNADRDRRVKRNYHLRNAREIYERVRKWIAENPDQAKAAQRNYRARKKHALGTHNAADILGKLALQGWRCYYCQVELTSYHVDHKIPLSKGGTDWPANVCCACPACNHRKSAKDFALFLDEIK